MEFTQKTYEVILEGMLSNIPGDHLKIEGSLIHAALAPAALELADMYSYIKYVYEQIAVATATVPVLDYLVEQHGVYRLAPTYATRRGEFYSLAGELVEVPIGSRYSLDTINFVVEESVGDGTYYMKAEESGTAGNYPIGQMQQLQFVDGLARAMVTDVIIPGEDAESDAALRVRYFEYLSNYAQDGNIGQYQKWATEYAGIGRAKIFPLWNGANSVKVSILNANNEKASDDLISEFQEYLDPDSRGLGNGVAPIGAKVTVSTATEKTIDLSVSIGLTDGFTIDSVKVNIKNSIDRYLTSTAYKKNKIFYMEVGAAILSADGVASVSGLTMNNSRDDITMGNEEIGKLGSLDIMGL